MSSLAEILPSEINRVRAIQDTYKELRNIPGVAVAHQIAMMERDIRAAIKAATEGDLGAMIRAAKELQGWTA